MQPQEMKFKIRHLIALPSLLIGCATHVPTAKVDLQSLDWASVHHWLGQDIYDLIDAWGRPFLRYQALNGREVYAYYSDASPSGYQIPHCSGESTGYGVSDCYQQRGGFESSIDNWCHIDFETSQSGQIIAWSQIGKGCELE